MSNRRLVFATRNAHKVRELAEIVAPLGLEVLPVSTVDPDAPEVPETGTTFEANAALKAIASWRRTGEWSLADDSGLCVRALNDAPGIHSARFSPEGGDAANNRKLMAELDGETDRAAHYVCALALVVPESVVPAGLTGAECHTDWPGLPDGAVLLTTRGRVDGHIGTGPRGDGGFGYDPYFTPEGHTVTFAEMSADEKHAISHRGRAFETLHAVLSELG